MEHILVIYEDDIIVDEKKGIYDEELPFGVGPGLLFGVEIGSLSPLVILFIFPILFEVEMIGQGGMAIPRIVILPSIPLIVVQIFKQISGRRRMAIDAMLIHNITGKFYNKNNIFINKNYVRQTCG